MVSTLAKLLYYFALTTTLVTSHTRIGEEYRLPNIYTPISYQVSITLAPEAFTSTGDQFSGQANIEFSVNNNTNSTDYIALHAHHDFITIDRVVFNQTEVSNVSYSIDNVTDILRINISSPIAPGEVYLLTIDYTGVLSTSDMYGFYKSQYPGANGSVEYLLTTQFEPAHARRAFPCFDEPNLKATFDFSFTVPTGLNVLFNTGQNSSVADNVTGLTTVTFNTTPRMSTYLVAFIVSEFTCTAGASIGTVPYQVCSRNSSAALRGLAVEYGSQLLSALGNYTGYEYGNAIEKMDQVAIPDFAAGAMENWGLVTYRETALLWDSNESSNAYRQRVITVVAHEFAHQWFGNLITLNWWSEIFLNEGFATYFEFHIAHQVVPDWELEKQFVIDELHPALLADSINTHALQSACSTPAEISVRFSTISYGKGGSILRMVEHFMGRQNFQAGVQNYISRNMFGNTVPEDLWLALNETVIDTVSILPANFTSIMENWVTKSGYPVLDVSANGREITISQRRFLLSGEDLTTKWYIPITYTTGQNTDKFQKTTPILWLTPNQDEIITLPVGYRWIVLNNQQSAFYRVNYDEILWNLIANALLQQNFDGITELNRAQIVDDLFNLARANHLKYSRVLDIIGFLTNDTSYFSWSAAYSGFDFLLLRVGETSSLGQNVSATILNLMANLYASVPITNLNETNQIYTLKQVLALSWACRLGNQDCIQQTQTLFQQFRSTGQRPNKNLRSIVYCNALRHSNNASDWDFLWQTYTQVSELATEQVTILSALGCTSDESILRQYLNKSITDGSGIRPQDALSVFASVYKGSSKGVDVAFEFLISNYQTIALKYSSMNSLGNLIKGIADRFTTEDQVARLRNFTQTGNLPEQFQVSANEALQAAESNLRWLQNSEADLVEYYNPPTSSSNQLRISFSIIFGAALLLLNNY